MKIHWPLTLKETDGEMARVWVPREHAEAEIEKARREGRAEGFSTRDEAVRLHLDGVEKKARADERERILAKAREYKDNSYTADRIVRFVDWLEHAEHGGPTPQEPKLLEPLMNITVADPNWADVVLAIQNTIESLNQTREAVNDLQRKARA